MATKLDKQFADGVKDGVNALVLEVERLEAQGEKQEKALIGLMAAYERRIRSDCTTPEALAAKPWECAEYCAARDALR